MKINTKILIGLCIIFIMLPSSFAVYTEPEVVFNDANYNYTVNTALNLTTIKITLGEIYFDDLPFCSSPYFSFLTTLRSCAVPGEDEREGGGGGGGGGYGGGLIIPVRECLLENGTWNNETNTCILPEYVYETIFPPYDLFKQAILDCVDMLPYYGKKIFPSNPVFGQILLVTLFAFLVFNLMYFIPTKLRKYMTKENKSKTVYYVFGIVFLFFLVGMFFLDYPYRFLCILGMIFMIAMWFFSIRRKKKNE